MATAASWPTCCLVRVCHVIDAAYLCTSDDVASVEQRPGNVLLLGLRGLRSFYRPSLVPLLLENLTTSTNLSLECTMQPDDLHDLQQRLLKVDAVANECAKHLLVHPTELQVPAQAIGAAIPHVRATYTVAHATTVSAARSCRSTAHVPSCNCSPPQPPWAPSPR